MFRRVSGRRGAHGEFLFAAASGGISYTVTVAGDGRVVCDPACPGFRYRRSCRHVQLVASALDTERATPTEARGGTASGMALRGWAAAPVDEPLDWMVAYAAPR